MKRFISFAVIAMVALSFSFGGGGRSSSSDSAQKYVENYLNAIKSENFEKVAGYLGYEGEEAKALVTKYEAAKREDGYTKLVKYELLSEELSEDGNEARIKVKETMSDKGEKETLYRVKKIDGKWAKLTYK